MTSNHPPSRKKEKESRTPEAIASEDPRTPCCCHGCSQIRRLRTIQVVAGLTSANELPRTYATMFARATTKEFPNLERKMDVKIHDPK